METTARLRRLRSILDAIDPVGNDLHEDIDQYEQNLHHLRLLLAAVELDLLSLLAAIRQVPDSRWTLERHIAILVFEARNGVESKLSYLVNEAVKSSKQSPVAGGDFRQRLIEGQAMFKRSMDCLSVPAVELKAVRDLVGSHYLSDVTGRKRPPGQQWARGLSAWIAEHDDLVRFPTGDPLGDRLVATATEAHAAFEELRQWIEVTWAKQWGLGLHAPV